MQTEDSSDAEFAKAVKDLADAAKSLGSVTDAMDKVWKGAVRSAGPVQDIKATVAAFEKPRAVVVVGPKPLPVSGDGGGGRAAGGTTGDGGGGRAAAPKPSEVEDGFFRRSVKESRFGQAFAKGEGGFRKAFGSSGPGHEGGLGKLGGGMAKGAGWAAVALEGAKALNDFRKAVQEASEAALRSARQYAETSASMAAVFAKKDIQDMLRDQKIGNATADSTGKLADAQSRRQDAVAPFEVAATNLQNNVLAWFENQFADGFETAREWVNKIIEVLTLGLEKEAIPKLNPDPGDPWGFGRVEAEAAKLDGRRLADIASSALARVRAGASAPSGAAPAGRLP